MKDSDIEILVNKHEGLVTQIYKDSGKDIRFTTWGHLAAKNAIRELMSRQIYSQDALIEAIERIEDVEHRVFLNNYIIHIFNIYMEKHNLPSKNRNEMLDGVLEDSLRLFPKMLEAKTFPNLKASAYTATIVKSAMAKYLHPYLKNQ